MKVNSSRPLQGASSAKRKDSASSASAFAPEGAASSGGPVSTTALSSASAIGSVDALLALQGAGDALSGKRQATERAFSLLDILDDLKLALKVFYRDRLHEVKGVLDSIGIFDANLHSLNMELPP